MMRRYGYARFGLATLLAAIALAALSLTLGEDMSAVGAASPDCSNGVAVSSPASNPGLVSDCENLLASKDDLRGAGSLDWSEDKDIGTWEGVTVEGAPPRVTELALR